MKAFCSSSQLTVDLIILNNFAVSNLYHLTIPCFYQMIYIEYPCILLYYTRPAYWCWYCVIGSTAIIRAVLIIKFLETSKRKRVLWSWPSHKETVFQTLEDIWGRIHLTDQFKNKTKARKLRACGIAPLRNVHLHQLKICPCVFSAFNDASHSIGFQRPLQNAS